MCSKISSHTQRDNVFHGQQSKFVHYNFDSNDIIKTHHFIHGSTQHFLDTLKSLCFSFYNNLSKITTHLGK